jgi:hypothetical protein
MACYLVKHSDNFTFTLGVFLSIFHLMVCYFVCVCVCIWSTNLKGRDNSEDLGINGLH